MPLFNSDPDTTQLFAGAGLDPTGTTYGGASNSSSGGWLSDVGNWVSSNKSDIQSALKGGASLASGTGSTWGGSGIRTDVSAQGGMHQGTAASLGDLFQQLMQRRAAASVGGGSRSGGLLGM